MTNPTAIDENFTKNIKDEARTYWTERAETFYQQRVFEMGSAKHDRWLAELLKYLPATSCDKPLRVLDVGCGAGFFSVILQQNGYDVVGIDITEAMVDAARKLAADNDSAAEFFVMDAENPAFENGSFDAIVTRNLTWTLPNADRAYARWFELLKPGGILVNCDGDYIHEDPKAPLPPKHAHDMISAEQKSLYEHMKDELRPHQHMRPAWDVELCMLAGFAQVHVDFTTCSRIFLEQDALYNPTPMFTIAAYKG